MAFKFPFENYQRLLSEERKSWQSPEKFLEVVKPKREEVWADVGCGPGYFTLELAKRVKFIYAIDYSQDMLRVCSERLKKNSLKNFKTLRSDEDRIPLEDKAVDRSLLANVLHELLKPEEFLKEVKRITKKEVIIIDWHPVPSPAGPPLEERIPQDRAKELAQRAGLKLKESLKVYPYHYFLVFECDE